jgi:hypothetical protein
MICGCAKHQSNQKRKLLSSKDTHLQSTLNTNLSKRQQIWTRITSSLHKESPTTTTTTKHPPPNHPMKKLPSAKAFQHLIRDHPSKPHQHSPHEHPCKPKHPHTSSLPPPPPPNYPAKPPHQETDDHSNSDIEEDDNQQQNTGSDAGLKWKHNPEPIKAVAGDKEKAAPP